VVDIFDEISEELRADRARALLVRYGGLLVGLCLAVVIAVAVWQWRQAQTDKENQRVASLFIAAAAEAAGSNTESGRAQAIAEFAAVERQGHAAYTALARLDEAELRSENGDLKGALVLWDQVAGDGSAAPAIRDLAVVLWVQHQLDQGDPVLLAGRLAPVLSPSNVWHGLASEEMALIQLRQGQTAAARERLQALEVDSTVSQNLRSRAAVELASLGG
jgi:hypothetical protein